MPSDLARHLTVELAYCSWMVLTDKGSTAHPELLCCIDYDDRCEQVCGIRSTVYNDIFA